MFLSHNAHIKNMISKYIARKENTDSWLLAAISKRGSPASRLPGEARADQSCVLPQEPAREGAPGTVS